MIRGRDHVIQGRDHVIQEGACVTNIKAVANGDIKMSFSLVRRCRVRAQVGGETPR